MIATRDVYMKMTAKEFFKNYSHEVDIMEIWYDVLLNHPAFEYYDYFSNDSYMYPWNAFNVCHLHGETFEEMAENYIKDYKIDKLIDEEFKYTTASPEFLYC